ncbi:hypothetical protein ABGT15_03065 [Flavobacterium enshiense]|uniref:hypothetical protein n=1 Tax=Flavobacterium enshiense TaxID=1341165 RepID=UPI00345CC33D
MKNYVDTKDATLKDAYPKTYDKVMPGCLTAEQLIKLKIFLKEKWLVDLEDLKTLNFYYAKNEKNINM